MPLFIETLLEEVDAVTASGDFDEPKVAVHHATEEVFSVIENVKLKALYTVLCRRNSASMDRLASINRELSAAAMATVKDPEKLSSLMARSQREQQEAAFHAHLFDAEMNAAFPETIWSDVRAGWAIVRRRPIRRNQPTPENFLAPGGADCGTSNFHPQANELKN